MRINCLALWAVLFSYACACPANGANADKPKKSNADSTEQSLLDERFEGDLGQAWTIRREDQNAWRVKGGSLQVRIQPGNMWGKKNDARNVLVRTLPENADLQRGLAIELTVATKPTERLTKKLSGTGARRKHPASRSS